MSDNAAPVNVEALNKIKEVVGLNGFVEDVSRMPPYLNAWRNGGTGVSPLVARPATTEQVAGIVAVCNKYKVPLVPQGGNTSLVGGSIPSMKGDEVVISMSRMNKVRELDAVGALVTVEAGVVLQSLRETVAKEGFLFPLSMASQGSAQIGGAISTNAGGVSVLRYGSMRNMVLGLEVVLPDGQIVSGLRKMQKDNTGYNLNNLFIGAEGTLGIVTAATLKLVPECQNSLSAVLAVADIKSAMSVLADIRKDCAEYMSAAEIMSHAALKLVMRHNTSARFPGKDDAPYYLLIELSSSTDAVPLRSIFEAIAENVLAGGKVIDAVIAESLAQGKEFWALREGIPEAIRKEGSGIHFDISLPLAQIADFITKAEPPIKEIAPFAIMAIFGHVGDGTSITICPFQAQDPDALAALKKRIQEIVYGEVLKRQGSISAEHGIGTERRAELLLSKTPLEVELMKKIKRMLDPQNIMNPGKIFEKLS